MNRWTGYLICVVVMLGLCGVSWGQVKATNPVPADGALDMDAGLPLLQWTPAPGTMLANVYVGTTADLGPDDLAEANASFPMHYHMAGLSPGTTYYWRVDAIVPGGGTIEGDVWMFMTQALTAYYPSPVDGGTATTLTPELTWLAGQGAIEHHVYFSDSETAVVDGAAEADKGIRDDPNYAPGELAPITTYYWRVDEVKAGDVEVAGEVWSFTSILPIDDFESYTNEVGERVFEVWVDGVGFTQPEPGNPGNGTGAAVGHDIWAPETPHETLMETLIVHGGSQSMPLYYNNTASPYYSEAERTWTVAQDWTAGGINTLTLHVRGPAADFVVPRVAPPPVIDGEADEIWQTASVQYINITIDGQCDNAEDCSGSFRVLYDAEYLYLLVDVNDEALVQDSDAAQGWLDDRIEVFIDGDNSKDDAQDGTNDYQYCFRWNHGVVETPVEWYRSPGSLVGVEYAVVTTDSGYLFEIKLPWSTMIGGPVQEGHVIGIDVMVGDDDDGGDRDGQISWHLPAGNPHTPSMWGTALLAEAETHETDVLYVALRDAFNRTAVITHPDPNAAKANEWVEWKLAFSDFAAAGTNLDLASVTKLFVGVGDRSAPKAGGAGLVFVDDIYLSKAAPVEEPNAVTE